MSLTTTSPMYRLSSTLIMAQIFNLTSPTKSSNNDDQPTLTSPTMQPETSFKLVGRGSKPSSPDQDVLEMIHKHFAKVIDPVAIATGIVGNALLALVFLITPLRLRPLSHALAGMGVADLLYTLSCMMVYLTNNGVPVYKVPGACQITTFTLVFSKAVEAWYIFISHLNRLSAHTKSGHERRRRRVFNTKFAIVIVSLLVAAPLFHLLWSMEVVTFGGTSYCLPMKEALQVHLILRKLETVTTVFLPLTLITGVDLMLIMKLALNYVFREDLEDDFKYEENISSFGTDKESPVAVRGSQFSSCDLASIKGTKGNHRLSTINEMSSSQSRGAFHDVKEVVAFCHHHDEQARTQCKEEVKNSSSRENNDVGAIHGVASFSSITSALSVSTNLNKMATIYPIEILKDATDGFINSSNVVRKNSGVTYLYSNEDVTVCNKNNLMEITKLESCPPQTLGVADAASQPIECKDDEGRSSPKLVCSVDVVLKSLKIFNCQKDHKVPVRDCHVTETRRQNYSFTSEAPSQTSVSASHWRSYTFNSVASNTSRSQAIPEDHFFPNDVTACTVGTMLTGLAYAALVLPSTYTQAVRLFLDVPSTRPSRDELQQAVLFESLVKINAVYKFLMYCLVMSSFRQAIMWLLTHWIPSKITRMSSICLWGSNVNKTTDTAFV